VKWTANPLIKWPVDKVSTALRFFLLASMSDFAQYISHLDKKKPVHFTQKSLHDFLTEIP